jgi:hypothetical protein
MCSQRDRAGPVRHPHGWYEATRLHRLDRVRRDDRVCRRAAQRRGVRDQPVRGTGDDARRGQRTGTRPPPPSRHDGATHGDARVPGHAGGRRRKAGTAARHHRATVPSYGRTARAQRHTRADGRSLAAVCEVTTKEAGGATTVRARARRSGTMTIRQVGSGRAPPRAGATDASEPPHASRRIFASVPPAPPATPRLSRPVVSIARPPARGPLSFATPPRVPRPGRPSRRPGRSLRVPWFPMRLVSDRLPARRPEGTAADSPVPS